MAAELSLSRFRMIYALSAAAILTVPLVSMQFTDAVNWAFGDFAIMVLLLAALGAATELSLRCLRSHWSRAISVALALTAFLFVWAMLAIG